MKFLHPDYLWLLLILIPLIVWYFRKRENENPSLGISSLGSFNKIKGSWKRFLFPVCYAMNLLGIACLIVALARPQTHDSLRNSRIIGTDIVLAIDISASMSATDFEPNRFEVAKELATKFVNNRPNDNIGLVEFAGESLSLLPLTTDKAALVNAISNIRMGDLMDGTAIGDGLTSAINRIVTGTAKSKSIILLTDGTNNAGDVPPETAAQIAREKGIRVYTVGIGTNGNIEIVDPYGFSTTTMETKIDENSLRNIADQTGGKFFRATNERALKDVFEEIDSLEKSLIDVSSFSRTDEDFMRWVTFALILFMIPVVIQYTVLRRIP